MINKYDTKQGYCRKLGHCVRFGYCRGVKEGLPCSKILDCWFEAIPIENFIHRNYNEEEISSIFTPSLPKIMTILNVVERIKNESLRR
ncbi:hypothetical protein ACFLRM_06525 [Acidobacteriota bacterium]